MNEPSEPSQPLDAVDHAAGLAAGETLHALRRTRQKVVDATQASHDALLFEPVDGLSSVDRLCVAIRVCQTAGATELAAHYESLLQREGQHTLGPALGAMLDFATLLTRDPRSGDRAALKKLAVAGLADATIVALAQLVAFLSYQIRVVAGLKAMR